MSQTALFLSGAAALVFEVVWFRRMTLVLGHTPVSFGVVASLAILGTGAGVLLFPSRGRNRILHPFRRAAALQAAFSVFALLPLHAGAAGAAGIAAASVLAGTVVAAAMAGWKETGTEREGGVGVFLAANFMGGGFGALCGGLFLIPRVGVRGTALAAAAAGLFSSALFFLSETGPRMSDRRRETPGEATRAPLREFAPFLALTGFTGFGAEILWGRWLSQLAGSSVYTYYSVLAVAIVAFGAGSLAYGPMSRGRTGFRGVVAGFPVLAAAYPVLLLGGLLLLRDRGFSPFHFLPGAGPGTPWAVGLLASVALFPPLFASGALFSGILDRRTSGGTAAGRHGVFANCLGAFAAGWLLPFVMVPVLGTGGCLAALGIVNLGIAVALSARNGEPGSGGIGSASLLICAVVLGLGAFGFRGTPIHFPLPTSLAAHRGGGGGPPAVAPAGGGARYFREGAWSTVWVGGEKGLEILLVDGKPESGATKDRPTQVMLSQLPFLLRGDSLRKVLLIGLGGGTTLDGILRRPVERVECVEISPEVVSALREAYDDERAGIVRDPRLRIRIGDGRKHLREGAGRYDLIVSQPSNPWVTGAASLFTREAFLEMAGALSPEGVAVLWLQSYGTPVSALTRELETVRSVFPCTLCFSYLPGDVLVVCARTPLVVDLGEATSRMTETDRIAGLLRSAGISRAEDFLGGFLGGSSTGAGSVWDAWNTDDRPRLEYALAGAIGNREPYAAYSAVLSPLEERISFLRGFPDRKGAKWTRFLTEWGEAASRFGFARFSGDLFGEALRLGGEPSRLLNDLGIVSLDRNDYHESIRYFQEALQADPENRSARENLGLLRKGGRNGRANGK